MALIAGYKGMVELACEDPLPFSLEPCTVDASGLMWTIDDADMRLWHPTEGNIVVEASTNGTNYSIVKPHLYSVRYAGGKVRFHEENDFTHVRVYGYYLTASECVQARQWDLDAGPNIKPAPVFGMEGGWMIHRPVGGTTKAKLSQWYADEWFFENLGRLMILRLYEDRTTGARYELACTLSKQQLKMSVQELADESLEFDGYGEPNYEAS